MELALTFGAIGDFISIASLIKDVLSALDDSRGSTKAYRDLIDEITHLQKALEQVEHIFRGPDLPSGLRHLISIAQSTITQVREALKEFQSRICKKYDNNLTEGGSGNIFKDAAKKIQFKLEEKNVAKFRAELAGHRMCLELFLQVTAVRLEQENHKAVMAAMSETARSTTAVVHRYGHSIESRLGFLGRRILSKLDFVARLGIDMTKSASQILSMMIAVSGDLSIIRSVVMRLDRGVDNGEHFVLEDATGRSFPIHIKAITSWEAFNFILEDRFKGKKGERRTRRKLYSLHESASHLEINRSTHFESAFLPYQKVDMSLICKAPETPMVDDGETGLSSCPWCQAVSPGKLGNRVQCSTCRRDFLRVVIEVEDSEDPRISSSAPRSQRLGKRAREDDDDEACNECSRLKRSKTAQVADRKRKRLQEHDSDSESDEENLSGLAHVTLQTKRMRLLGPDNVADEDSDQELKSAGAALNEQLDVRSPVLDRVSSAKTFMPLDEERESSVNLPGLNTNVSRGAGGSPSHPAVAQPQHRENPQVSPSIYFHHWQLSSSQSGGRRSSEQRYRSEETRQAAGVDTLAANTPSDDTAAFNAFPPRHLLKDDGTLGPTRPGATWSDNQGGGQVPMPSKGMWQAVQSELQLQGSILTYEEKRQYPFPCMVADCNKRFVLKTDLQRHQQGVHFGRERRHKCNYCSRLFAREDTLKR
ncbi:hypothetical protein V8F33_008966 [Rhypophila sp. PSN 637]